MDSLHCFIKDEEETGSQFAVWSDSADLGFSKPVEYILQFIEEATEMSLGLFWPGFSDLITCGQL